MSGKKPCIVLVAVLPILIITFACAMERTHTYGSAWPGGITRTWIGPECWANRLQDWRLVDGRLECLVDRQLPMRTVHLLTHRLGEKAGSFEMSTCLGLINADKKVSGASAAGFLVGVGGSAMDYRSAALIHALPGTGGGIFCAIDPKGKVFFHDNEKAPQVSSSDAVPGAPLREVVLRLQGIATAGGDYTLKLSSHDAAGKVLGEATMQAPSVQLIGNVALVSHPGAKKTGPEGGRYWFRDWKVSGDKVDADPSRSLGPIVSTQYTLSRGILKMTAQMMPLGLKDNDTVQLWTRAGGTWKKTAQASIITPGYTATFRVADWDATKNTPFRVSYALKTGGSKAKSCTWEGIIRKDPEDKETIVVAGFTGNHNNAHGTGVGRGGLGNKAPVDWIQGIWFPHLDIIRSVAKHEPDVLFFSGDQVYEGNSPTFADRANIKLDYLYKWYLWCWAYRDLTRDIPSVTIPDDHDVYQGNLWGEGGRKIDKDDKGGYVHPADFVMMSERTQTSHLPDPPDPEPIEQGIGVYFTDMRYGRVGFAILEDRKFKSGCNGRVAGKKRGRADHINDPEFDMKQADAPGLKLLGDRQLDFLGAFCADWEGEDMKMALSQTVFANMATHHGGNLFRLLADLDSNGWPQSGRNRALSELRRGFALHLAGDQHLATIVHHGVDEHNDAIWSFAVPSVANFYPRAWLPEAEGRNRPEGAPANMGEHIDGLGNKITVYGATNPTAITGKSTGKEPLELHDKMPGYGIVRLNKKTREYTLECWPRYVDPEDPESGKQYEGWPRTVAQMDNYNRKAAAWLPEIECTGMENPVIQVIEEGSGEIIYTLRINGARFRPRVFKEGTYTLKIGEPGTDKLKVFKSVASMPEASRKTLQVMFGR